MGSGTSRDWISDGGKTLKDVLSLMGLLPGPMDVPGVMTWLLGPWDGLVVSMDVEPGVRVCSDGVTVVVNVLLAGPVAREQNEERKKAAVSVPAKSICLSGAFIAL